MQSCFPFQGQNDAVDILFHSWNCQNLVCIHYSSYHPLYLMSILPPRYAVPGCIVSRRAHVICCAELKIIFQPEALEWPYVLGERELAPQGDDQTSNHQPVLLLILLNSSKRWETLSHIKKTEASFYTLCLEIPVSHSPSTTGINGFVAFCNNAWPKHPEICMRAFSQKDREHDFVPNFPQLHWARD